MFASKQVGWLLTGSLLAGLMSAGFVGEEAQWQPPASNGGVLVEESTEEVPVPLIAPTQLSGEVEGQVEQWLQARTVWR